MSLSKLFLCPYRQRSLLNPLLAPRSKTEAPPSKQLVIDNRLLAAPFMIPCPLIIPFRRGHYIPATQYDMPIPKKFIITHALKVNWELIPIVVIIAIACLGIFFMILWCTQHKVDVVFRANSRNNISRTMDLRNPTYHKLVIINQRYDPWPEMQDVLDKMKVAESQAYQHAMKSKCKIK